MTQPEQAKPQGWGEPHWRSKKLVANYRPHGDPRLIFDDREWTPAGKWVWTSDKGDPDYGKALNEEMRIRWNALVGIRYPDKLGELLAALAKELATFDAAQDISYEALRSSAEMAMIRFKPLLAAIGALPAGDAP